MVFNEHSTSGKVRALHIPQDTRNPYQCSLTAALSRNNVAAVLVRTSDVVAHLMDGWTGRTLLHIHWLPRGYWSPRNLLDFIRFRAVVRCARKRQASVVWTVHNLFSHESKNRGRERRLARFVIKNANGLIVHSPAAAEMVRKEFKVPLSKPLVWIPHGNYIETYPATISASEARSRLRLLPEHRVAVFLGNIRPYKGVPELLEAFRSVPFPDARLVIAGQPQDNECRALIERAANRDPRVLLHLGFVPDDEIQVYMHASDVVVLPYLNVLTSGAAVLAMSFGRACVAPRSGCLPDYFIEQPELLYNANKPEALTRALMAGLADPRASTDIGARNLRLAQTWSWESVAQQTKDFYLQCSNQAPK